ncbi:related to PRP12 - involved in early maturation of pre-rRNA [Melanopsichium pennsylvanicum]|uniref:Mitochondrial escape protein 2 n=2 Tax=Melanopsichium pennsylvanicum TaxID=63383 RepID=A0AAJ4XMV8_9BASI|nr:related to PRP12-involved in early maturation of pre-rRNA [Melanopsichium pennsylvanicum 4]SNX85177.1 related to PRP12 - involved in early maturation of pre-rRNA [Melanopsichium pennsylvanicum]
MYLSRASSRLCLASGRANLPPLHTSSFITKFSASTLVSARLPRTIGPTLTYPAEHSNGLRWSSSAALASTSPEAAKVAEDAETETESDPFRKIGYLYFDTVFPIRLGFWDIRYMLASLEKRSVLDRIKASLPPDQSVGYGFKVIGAEERMKDGGAFVTFSYREDPNEKNEESLNIIEKRLKSGVRRVFNPLLFFLGTPGVHVVRGKPFREDMNIFPATRIFVKLEGGDASEEQLWQTLRPYGRIVSITKEKPSEAFVTFSRTRGATSARNCAHGLELPNGARFIITFRSMLRSKQAWDWISNHPRLVFPLVAFLIGGISYMVFDPVREFMVESKVHNTFSLDEYRVYTWLKQNTVGLFKDTDGNVKGDIDDWWERRQSAETIQEWIREKPSTFVTISGPRGSGKSGLVNKAITRDVQHLVIDCDAIAKTAKNDSLLITSLANETGYWPVFSWLSSINSMIDLAAVGLIGSKAGFATPTDAQLKQILAVVTNALNRINEQTQKRIARAEKARLAAEKKEKKPFAPAPTPAVSAVNAEANEKESFEEKASELAHHAVESIQSLVTGEYDIDADKGGKKGKTFDSPVVVIKQFHHKGIKQAILHQVLAEWATELVTNGIAHVVFVSDNPVGMGKELAKALPNVPFQGIALADAEEDKARSYVYDKLREMGRLPVLPSSAANGASPPVYGSTATTVRSTPAAFATSDADFNFPQSDATQPSEPQYASALDDETASWVDKLGGRLTDLETLIQKVSLGQSVESAVQDIISRSVVELRKNAFGDDASEASSLPWTRSQAWTVVNKLAKKGEVSYYGLLHNEFKGNEGAIKSLEQAEIISVRHHDGRPSAIRAGRPVMQEAIQRLVSDHVFNDTQTLLANTGSIESAEKSLHTIEAEIADISKMIQGSPFKVASGTGSTNGAVLPWPEEERKEEKQGFFSSLSWRGGEPEIKTSEAAKARTEFLMSKMAELQTKISKLDAQNSAIKARLAAHID